MDTMVTPVYPLSTALLAFIAVLLLGVLWYSPPVWGRAWMRVAGLKPQKKDGSAYVRAVLLGITANLLTVTVFMLLLVVLRVGTMGDALLLIALLWLGFMLPVLLHDVAWERRSPLLLVINGGYFLLSLLLTAVMYITVSA